MTRVEFGTRCHDRTSVTDLGNSNHLVPSKSDVGGSVLYEGFVDISVFSGGQLRLGCLQNSKMS